jgi:membrane glycosyltransferase
MTAEFVSSSDRVVVTSTQRATILRRRRFVFAFLVGLTLAGLVAWLGSILANDGFDILDLLMIISFLIYAPWIVIGFWNSLIGLILLRSTVDPVRQVMPEAVDARDSGPMTVRSAVVMTIRNEEPARVFAHLELLIESLGKTGHGHAFDYFLLSDSSLPQVIGAEEQAFEVWYQKLPPDCRLVYRRRESNVGFKGGNVHEFCERNGHNYEFMVLLDTDSLMSGETVVRFVRIMQSNPRIGILQSLAVGLPSTSLFARIFQFGHRLGMRVFVLGAGWWQGDRCQFWGHNAVIRLAPFTQHCRLPVLPGRSFGGHIICHDQIEAVLMYSAGYEVRLLPQECGSYEGNPPALPDYLQRNSRWCQGNLQNLRLIGLASGKPVSLFHLVFMAQKFIGAAAVVTFVVLAAIAAALKPADASFPAKSALAFYGACVIVLFMPKLCSILDTLSSSPKRYGGVARFLVGGLVEVLFTFLLVPASFVASTSSLIGLFAGRPLAWDGQRRAGYRLSLPDAVAALWVTTSFGLVLLSALALAAPGAIVWFLPFLSGLLLAIPFALMTSSATIAALAAKLKICAGPEEIDPPSEIARITPLLMQRR